MMLFPQGEEGGGYFPQMPYPGSTIGLIGKRTFPIHYLLLFIRCFKATTTVAS